jgi:hypothetical protein
MPIQNSKLRKPDFTRASEFGTVAEFGKIGISHSPLLPMCSGFKSNSINKYLC